MSAATCSVDGVDCLVQEQRRHLAPSRNGRFVRVDPAFFSFKYRHAALRYNVVVALRLPLIVNVHGGVPASQSEIGLARRHLVPIVEMNEVMLADNAYSGEQLFLAKPRRGQGGSLWNPPNYFTRAHGRALARHELVNGFLKRYRVLTAVFHHRPVIERHRLCFLAVCNLVNIKMEVNPAMLMSLSVFPRRPPPS